MTTYRLMDGATGRPAMARSPTSYGGPLPGRHHFLRRSAGKLWLEGYYRWVPTGVTPGARKFGPVDPVRTNTAGPS